jgi:DNA-binding MarR family transcriptional regulator
MSAQSTHLYHRLQTTAHLVKKQADRALVQATGVTTAQVAVLTVVQRDRRTNQRSVAAQLDLNESAISGMVGRLLELGYVRRERQPDDGRTWALTLTPAGRGALQRAARAFATINDQLDTAVNPDRLAAELDSIRSTFAATDVDVV